MRYSAFTETWGFKHCVIKGLGMLEKSYLISKQNIFTILYVKYRRGGKILRSYSFRLNSNHCLMTIHACLACLAIQECNHTGVGIIVFFFQMNCVQPKLCNRLESIRGIASETAIHMWFLPFPLNHENIFLLDIWCWDVSVFLTSNHYIYAISKQYQDLYFY